MRARQQLLASLQAIVKDMGLSWPEKATLEPPRDKSFGDLAANIALVLSKDAGVPPRELASRLAGALRDSDPAIASVDIAGPGFLNVTYSPDFWRETVLHVEAAGDRYGATTVGAGRKAQVEYVSANPTGPLHIGHGRGAALGDCLARVLRFAGYDVTTEYYINDAGRQMRLLGLSVWLRALELSGRPFTLPEDFYRGDYIKDIAAEMLAKDPGLVDLPEAEGQDRCFEYAMSSIMDGIKQDLADFRVEHQVWFSELSLVREGAVEKTFERLKAAGLAFEQDGALWFRTTTLGDDKDRVLRKSDGTLTYFASDIAYHDNKYDRGFDLVVDIWGADHHGYVPRMRAAVAALGKRPEQFDVILVQLVNLLQNGEQIAMSTRAGQFETLHDVVREVGADAARFMFLSRKSDSHLDFDLELVKQRSMDNPVYYVQYAHARVCAVLRKAAERSIVLPARLDAAALAPLTLPEELDLLRLVDRMPDTLSAAAEGLAPHHVSFYLMEVAGALHSYYAKVPVLNAADAETIVARLALLRVVGQAVANGLNLLGVEAPEAM
ncbi:arginine--tRNA ligase [Nitratidesulfovibrio sp. SRB-5]|uniref:arginine--tRNA ligase n=1 Tax=Nitratidesulfovibrio sp. SRB-5 TaxID=2872636 RepID=UPI001024C617|nr:arginine--tRNA ligase [Nitratidesulfovibrio sp. SRB-5]MBZ2172834.1 arginine--tRNA ligase [Nitratidesulfovibrio sp. SRB-5]RXF76900.1 arginine--tRNA ligase [Desulfovibrio sp. DS-1]